MVGAQVEQETSSIEVYADYTNAHLARLVEPDKLSSYY